VSLYLDVSVLVALFVIDPSSARAEAFLSAHPEIVVVSDFGAAEFLSAVARRVRTRDLTRADGRLAFSNFDTWIARSAYGRRSRPPISTQQIGFCGVLMSTFALPMRSTSRSLGDWRQRSSLSTEAWPPARVPSAYRLRRPEGLSPATGVSSVMLPTGTFERVPGRKHEL
jgi:hypothetical protein